MHFEAKDSTVIPWNDLESSGMLSYPNITQDKLLSHNFPETRSKVKTCRRTLQSENPKNELREMGLQRTVSKSRLVLRANCPQHGCRSETTFKPLHCVPHRTIAWDTFRTKTCLRISLNVFVGLESCQTHCKPTDKSYQPRNAQESSNSCSYPNTGYWLQ